LTGENQLTRHVLDTVVTKMTVAFVGAESLELAVHGRVVNLRRLADCNPLPFSLLVEQEKEYNLDADDDDESDENYHDGEGARSVTWCVLSFEKKWSDNVSSRRRCIEEGHDD